MAGSPPANSENTVGADTTQFVQAPLEGEATPSLGSLQESSSAHPPVMADLFAGPHAPLSKAFLFCGWRCLPVDVKLDASHDLSNPLRQDSLRGQLDQIDFIAAAFDCSTKSRAREIPRPFQDGRPAPKPSLARGTGGA